MTDLKEKPAILVDGFLKGIILRFFGDKTPNIWRSEPTHPGELMERLLPKLSLTPEDVSLKCAMPIEKLNKLFNGNASFDENVRDQLRPSLGDATDLLYKHQKTFDYYAFHRKWPDQP